MILPLWAVEISLPTIRLKRAGVLALGVIGVRYSAWARCLVALVLTVSVINSLSKRSRADKKED